MPDSSEKNEVIFLRERTEKENMEHYLKRTLGGYSKKSIMEYMAVFRKQQMAAAETFNQNLQELYEEKKSLLESSEVLKTKAAKAEAELKSLTEAIATYKLEGESLSVQDIIALKSKNAALEAEIRKACHEKQQLETKIDRLNDTIGEMEAELKTAKQETQIQKELLITEKAETKKQHDLVADLSRKAEGFRDEAQYLKGIITEGETAKLQARIDELMADTAKQAEIIVCRNAQLAEKEKAEQTLREENGALKESVVHLTESVDKIMVQNRKLELYNQELSARLEEANKNTIELINQKSGVTVEKLILRRKLDEANLRFSSLEMQTCKEEKQEAILTATASPEPKHERKETL
jgi:Chromosome segregation ATPases